ncbi:MAG: hypothetical protein IT561_28370 [Alphaproteobacteria bacterium]|nr:hypothetical protein [Alphaproteobacteria bacterium]
MATFSKIPLSGSTDGRPVKVAATATAGTLIHTAQASATNPDELWLWVTNTSGAAVVLTIEWGGVTDPDDLICKQVSIPANSPPTLVVAGLILRNSLVARAFAGSANVLLIEGFVNRIS